MDEDSIYFFLSSIGSLNFHPNNKAYNFTVEVPERTSLSGDWEVGIFDFYASTVTNETLYLFSDFFYCRLLLCQRHHARYIKAVTSNKFE